MFVARRDDVMWECVRCGYRCFEPDPDDRVEEVKRLNLDGSLKTKMLYACPHCDHELINLDWIPF